MLLKPAKKRRLVTQNLKMLKNHARNQRRKKKRKKKRKMIRKILKR